MYVGFIAYVLFFCFLGTGFPMLTLHIWCFSADSSIIHLCCFSIYQFLNGHFSVCVFVSTSASLILSAIIFSMNTNCMSRDSLIKYCHQHFFLYFIWLFGHPNTPGLIGESQNRCYIRGRRYSFIRCICVSSFVSVILILNLYSPCVTKPWNSNITSIRTPWQSRAYWIE